MNLDEIKSTDRQFKLNDIGNAAEGLDDIDQCIKIILMTRKGSVPHRPEFGSDIWQYIDYPINESIPNIIKEAYDAITLWETRVLINSITAEIAYCEQRLKDGGEEPSSVTPFIASKQANGSQIILKIDRQIKNTDISGVLEVNI